jgi:acetyltransferase
MALAMNFHSLMTHPAQAMASERTRSHGWAPRGSDVLTLNNGRAVTIRPVRPQDAEATGRFVEQGLSPTSRRRRFHAAIRSLTPTMLAAMTQVDQEGHIALVAESWDADDGRHHAPTIIAEARYVVEARGDQAELALAVADAWQGQGLGAALLGALCRHARLRHLRALRADVMADNAPMLTLLRTRGSRESRHPDDASLRQLWLPVGDVVSVAAE